MRSGWGGTGPGRRARGSDAAGVSHARRRGRARRRADELPGLVQGDTAHQTQVLNLTDPEAIERAAGVF